MQAAERTVSEGKLSIPSWGLTVENPPNTWLLSCVDPDKPVVFIDTDSVSLLERLLLVLFEDFSVHSSAGKS